MSSGKSFELEDATLARLSSAVSSLVRHSWRPRSCCSLKSPWACLGEGKLENKQNLERTL